MGVLIQMNHCSAHYASVGWRLELSIMALPRNRVTYILLIMASYCPQFWNIEEHDLQIRRK